MTQRPQPSAERAAEPVQLRPSGSGDGAGRASIYDFGCAATASPVQLESFDRAIQRLHDNIASANAVQRKEAEEQGTAPSVQQAAAHGVKSGGGSLPHLGTIQKAFGSHDVSAIQAHVGGDAKGASQAMGAEAYATGNHVAFQKSPSLHTAAHEAAHVVQQRAGVQLAGGVGKVGDVYEKNADAVADAVVQGKSAEGLLGEMRGGGSQAVQRAPAARGQVQQKSDTAAIALGALADTIAALPNAANRVTNVWELMAFPTAVATHAVGRMKAGTVFGSGQLTPGRIRQIADTATGLRTGNCLENACTSAVFASGRNATNIMVLSIPNHLFIAINLKKGADASKPATWGEDAYIIDGWNRKAFPAREYAQNGLLGLSFEAWYKG